MLDYVQEVEHMRERLVRLEHAIDEAVETAPARMRAVIESLQALRGIARVSAATIVSEVGELSRFQQARQLMGYSGAVAREDSTGERIRRGGITQNRERTSASHRHRGGLGVSAPPDAGPNASEATGTRECRGASDRLEGAAPLTCALPGPHCTREMSTPGGHGDRS